MFADRSVNFKNFVTPSHNQLFILPRTSSEAETGLDKSHAQACKTSKTSSIFWLRKFCLTKNKNSLDLQIHSRLD